MISLRREVSRQVDLVKMGDDFEDLVNRDLRERLMKMTVTNEGLRRRLRLASVYVETPIVMRTNFSGEPPYVGWKGLGLALTEALDERAALLKSAATRNLDHDSVEDMVAHILDDVKRNAMCSGKDPDEAWFEASAAAIRPLVERLFEAEANKHHK